MTLESLFLDSLAQVRMQLRTKRKLNWIRLILRIAKKKNSLMLIKQKNKEIKNQLNKLIAKANHNMTHSRGSPNSVMLKTLNRSNYWP